MSSTDVKHYRLIGTEISYFTGKLRAYMQWKGIPFTQVLASNAVYRDLVQPLTHTAIIPVLLLPGSPPRALQDTRVIIRHLEAHHPTLRPDHPAVPVTPRRAAAANLLELLADQWLLLPAMHYRWSQPLTTPHQPFILSEFGDTATAGAKASLSSRLDTERKSKRKFSALLPGLGITPETVPAIEWQFRELCRRLETHFAAHRYLLGDRISLADFSLYGPFYAHLFRDPVPGFLVATEFPLVHEWVERVAGLGRGGGWNNVERYLGNGKFVADYPDGPEELERADALPETVRAVVQLMLADYLPVLRGEAEALKGFLEAGHGKKKGGWTVVPRRLGEQEFKLEVEGGNVKGKRGIMTHGCWMVKEMVKEVEQAGAWAEVVRECGGNLDMWEGVVGVLEGWEIIREDGLYLARREEEKAKL